MNKTSIAAAVAIVVSSLFVGGCGDGDIARMAELEEIKATSYEQAGDDCDKIAKALEEFNTKYGKEHKALMAKLKDKYKDDKAGAEKASEKYKERLDKSKKIIIGAVFKCSSNEAYSKAMKAGSE